MRARISVAREANMEKKQQKKVVELSAKEIAVVSGGRPILEGQTGVKG